MYWLLIIFAALVAAVLLFLGWLSIFGGRPVYQRHQNLDEFEGPLRQLAELMAEESVYIIEHLGSPRFIQFRKLKHGVLFGFPDAPWARNYFDKLAGALCRAGESVEIVPTNDAPVTRFLEVRLAGETEVVGLAAVRVARIAATAMELSEGASFRGHFKGDFDPEAYLARYGPSFEQCSQKGPRLIRSYFRWHLRSLRRHAGGDRSLPKG